MTLKRYEFRRGKFREVPGGEFVRADDVLPILAAIRDESRLVLDEKESNVLVAYSAWKRAADAAKEKL